MVDSDWKTKMVSSDLPTNKSPKLSPKPRVTIPAVPINVPALSPVSCSSSAACSAYELYLRLPELRSLWSSRGFPLWNSEPVLKPALQALEITFRLILAVFSDERPYTNRREWRRRLEMLATSQVQLVAAICEDDAEAEEADNGGLAPVGDRRSELSLLPQLATWRKTEDVGLKILSTIDTEMRRSRYALGLGERNLTGKKYLRYDAVCRPNEIHSLKNNPFSDHIDNRENQILYTVHQILESWIQTSLVLLNRIESRIGEGKFEEASSDVYLLERIWKLLSEIEDLHLLMDPDDFLKLKNQIQIKSSSHNDAFCFRSRGIVEMAKRSKELRQKVPAVLAVEVDPAGGPRLQDAAMRLYARKREPEKIHLLQGMQAAEAAAKRFFFAYRQLVATVMGSAEATASHDPSDSLTRAVMEPTYFPSLDAAKTFLGEFWGRWGATTD
ncbi:PREDICTED: nematode resistance protein-like HSPRO2 [Tarenaya hassleriana]|uniref:nematode resistance protein-like HSPRO2 n=1 Tax=Tarenaya hassleriana TaxID=28532 RepID=UPI00053C61BE|nr:PREDICTED: nematode resistance protein-like HSPRO2 [Tarenaya hassleriana]